MDIFSSLRTFLNPIISTKEMRRICDAIEDTPKPFVSFEFYPPRTEKGVSSLKSKLVSLHKQNPLFIDFTWGAGGSTSDLTLELVAQATADGFTVNMHLTCTNMPASLVDEALEKAKAIGVRNICALRGDPPAGQDRWEPTAGGFACALDLVKHIKKKYGDYFCIAVSGYPEGHPNVIKKIEPSSDVSLSPTEQSRVVRSGQDTFVCSDEDFEKELQYLKQKVDMGADLVITQLFYDTNVFLQFVKRCREIGIACPILPGIMPITKAEGFKKMTLFCKTRVPTDIQNRLDHAMDDAESFKLTGWTITKEICQTLIESGVHGLHLYTLNFEQPVMFLLEQLGLAV